MASPMDAFKNNLFGQLKTYGDAVQGVFEQRIARPLLAFKRDFSRASSATRTPSEQIDVTSHDKPTLASTPLEIIDIESNDPLKTLLDKFKNTFSPATKRRTSEDCSNDEIIEKPSTEERHSSISALSNKTHRRNRFRHNKSVSFAEHIEVENGSSNSNHNLIFPTLMDGQITNNNEEITTLNSEDDETDFQRHFYQAVRPRRMSIGHGKDLVYQDLSAEIVAYVLKHAVRAIEKEDQELALTNNHKNEQDDELIDLK